MVEIVVLDRNLELCLEKRLFRIVRRTYLDFKCGWSKTRELKQINKRNQSDTDVENQETFASAWVSVKFNPMSRNVSQSKTKTYWKVFRFTEGEWSNCKQGNKTTVGFLFVHFQPANVNSDRTSNMGPHFSKNWIYGGKFHGGFYIPKNSVKGKETKLIFFVLDRIILG